MILAGVPVHNPTFTTEFKISWKNCAIYSITKGLLFFLFETSLRPIKTTPLNKSAPPTAMESIKYHVNVVVSVEDIIEVIVVVGVVLTVEVSVVVTVVVISSHIVSKDTVHGSV